MSCCRKSKRPKSERPLELGVSLEEQRGSLLEESATPGAAEEIELEPQQGGSATPEESADPEQIRSLTEGSATTDENDRRGKENKGFLIKGLEKRIEELEQHGAADLPHNDPLYELHIWMKRLKGLLEFIHKGFQEKLLEMIDNEEEITPEDLADDLASDSENWLNKIYHLREATAEDLVAFILKTHKNKKKNEDDLLEKINVKGGNEKFPFDEITPRALANCESSSLLMSMKVSFQLRNLADRKTADEEKYNQKANSVEAFTYSLLDPLRNETPLRERFGEYVLDYVIEDAIDLEQKKFFTHPAVEDELNRKFHGRDAEKTGWNRWQLLLFRFFCFFDLLFLPILFMVFSLLEKLSKRGKERRSKRGEGNEEANEKEKSNVTVENVCRMYSTPYAKFVRDTLSYIVLAVLHYVLCLSPSTIAFSRLEWVILVFFAGRYLVERKQILDIMKRLKQRRKKGNVGFQTKWIRLKTLSEYLSDPWNSLDFISLLVYLIIITLKVTTMVTSRSEMNNRALAIAGYFYSFNTLCLTMRVFGHVTEQSRHLGVIQIALFNILKDISTIILQFIAGILAFSIAITKVFMAEKSFIANGIAQNDITCRNSGPSCWWMMVTHLGWSLLGAQETDPLASVDVPSETVAQILYAAFLVFGVILLVNMLIALLSNTWQRTVENSLKVWTIKRAITIQTYDAYDPVPVPLNIIYNIGKLLRLVGKLLKLVGSKDKKEVKLWVIVGRLVIKILEDKYFEEHKDNFPVRDEDKFELVRHEVRTNQEQMEKVKKLVSDVLCTTFSSQGGDQGELCVGPEIWKANREIRIEGPLLTCDVQDVHGARYRKHFSVEFPHFEVVIIETGRGVGIGAVREDNDTDEMPGKEEESVGYRADKGKIYHNEDKKKTEGHALAHRGDRILCTVLYEKEKEKDGKRQVPVTFSLNGEKIITEEGDDQFFVDSDKPLYPCIGMKLGSIVLAKMLRDDEQALTATSTSQGSDPGVLSVGPEMWDANRYMRIEAPPFFGGAAYREQFSAEFPHFEVLILETGEDKLLGIGATAEDYNTSHMLGSCKESVGYYADDGNIFHNGGFKETQGLDLVHRGDRIRCTAMYDNEKEKYGKRQVPVTFSLNGRKIIAKEGEDQFFLDCDKPLYPYISMTPGSVVLAKMCPREVEDLDSKVRKSLEETNQKVNNSLEELVKEVEKNRESLEETNQKVNTSLEELVKEVEKNKERLEETNRKLEELVKDAKKNKDEINQKLDVLLARLTDSKKD
ncbi:uncharacterized protein LOC144634914 isoform X2 [Oculina patagonica]